MKANSTKQTFFNPSQHVPKRPESVDDLQQHSIESFKELGFERTVFMNNIGYLKNQVELHHQREYQLASRVMYNAGIEVIKNNPWLLHNYNNLSHSIQEGDYNSVGACNASKARFVILLGLEASKQQLGLEWVQIKVLQLLPNIFRNYSIRPSTRIELANGEILATDYEYFKIMHAFLKANDVDVSNYPVHSHKEENAYFRKIKEFIPGINFDYDVDYDEKDEIKISYGYC